jgi:galactokinase
VNDTFAKAIELAAKLPLKDREELGALLLEEMRSQQRWSKLFKASQDQLDQLADQAVAEHKTGKTQPWA